ncbi:MAG: 50S ribosomal protein L4 [Candidatus Margulisiibacteriota bacterium]|mgnify:CR=1 FL=1
MKLKSYSLSSQKAGEIQVKDHMFDLTAVDGLIHFLVHTYRLRGMRKTAKVKTRAEVSGGGCKPWRQKGTGRARAGTIRSPLWVGGGVIFGPQNVKRHIKVNKKVARKGLLMALSAKSPDTVVLESAQDFETSIKKVSDFLSIMQTLEMGGKKILFVTQKKQSREVLLGNISRLKIQSVHGLNIVDIVDAQGIIFEDASLQQLEEMIDRG